MRSTKTNPPAVVDLDAARRLRRPRPARYTYGFTQATGEAGDEPMLVRCARNLEQRGFAPREQLAMFVALPDHLWSELWAELRAHIERERAA